MMSKEFLGTMIARACRGGNYRTSRDLLDAGFASGILTREEYGAAFELWDKWFSTHKTVWWKVSNPVHITRDMKVESWI